MRNYLKAANFYSYDATEDENPVMRWIGREVKRFIAEGYIHLPFLLRVAAAPPRSDRGHGRHDKRSRPPHTHPTPPATAHTRRRMPPTHQPCTHATNGVIANADDDEFELERRRTKS